VEDEGVVVTNQEAAEMVNFANSLVRNFEQTGQLSDLETSISLYRELLVRVPAQNRHWLASLNNLGAALLNRFERTGTIQDLEEAIVLHREVLVLRPAFHPNRSSALNNLANALFTRFGQTGMIQDVEEAIALHREALVLRPEPHPNRSSSLNNLASVLSIRFSQTGMIQDMDEAIALHREALVLLPLPHPNRSASLNNLASVLSTRFGQTGMIQDMDEAIAVHREALMLLPPPHPNRSASLNNLANVLSKRFNQTGTIQDVDEAVALHREALVLRPAPHPERSTSLNNLASVFFERFSQTGLIEDVDEAIALHREALMLLSAPHPNRPSFLSNLAFVLQIRFSKLSQLPDLEEAVMVCRESLRMLPQDHPRICMSSQTLAKVLMDMYFHTRQSGYFDDAVVAFRTAAACETAAASERLQAAQLWAHRADAGSHGSALEAYQCAIRLLPRLVMLSLDVQSRLRVLKSGTNGLAQDAADYAIRSGHFDQAVEFLEEGRNIFWSQALQLRASFDQLHLIAPDLAQKLQGISRALEQGALQDISTSPDTQHQLSLEQEAARCRRLNEVWLLTVEEAQRLDGFEHFLCPTPLAKLQTAAANGPVIILNSSKSGCTALIMTSSGIDHVPLPECSMQFAWTLVRLIQHAAENVLLAEPQLEDLMQQSQSLLEESYRDDRHVKWAARNTVSSDGIFQRALAILWNTVAKPVIHHLALMVS
jgi:hypothetical protein